MIMSDSFVDDLINAAVDRFYDDADPQHLDELVAALHQAAINGNVAAIKEIADRVDGPVSEAVVGDDEHPPVRITVSWKSEPTPKPSIPRDSDHGHV
jgi:hypothetical protein